MLEIIVQIDTELGFDKREIKVPAIIAIDFVHTTEDFKKVSFVYIIFDQLDKAKFSVFLKSDSDPIRRPERPVGNGRGIPE